MCSGPSGISLADTTRHRSESEALALSPLCCLDLYEASEAVWMFLSRTEGKGTALRS